MASKPTKPDWIPDDTSDIIVPSGSKQTTGWIKSERPPFEFFNWFFNIVSQFIDYFSGESEFNVIIDSDTDEGDYTTLAAYIADSPAAGDRVLLKVDEEITGATMVIPANILIKQEKGKKLWCDEDLATVLQFSDGVVTEGDLLLELSHTGTVANAVSLNGDDNNHANIIVKNTTTGTITSVFEIESAKEGNLVKGEVLNPSGTVTNILLDSSGVISNDVYIRKSGGSAFRPDGLGCGWHGDQSRIKILPNGFVTNTAGNPEYMNSTGELVTSASGNLVACVVIPIGYKATHARAYASAAKTVNVRENDITDGTISSKGTGNTTAEIDITDVIATTTNYLSIEIVGVSSAGVYGGYITIAPI